MEVDVFLSGWEIECCRPPPGEGDHVAWPLQWVDAPSGPGALELAWSVQGSMPGTGPLPGVLLLARGPLRAWWHGLAPAGIPDRGGLIAALHGGLPDDVAPPVTATVLSVRVVEQAYRLTGRGYEPIDGAYTLRPVPRSPQWFTRRPSGGAEPLPDVVREDSGVLVGLAVVG